MTLAVTQTPAGTDFMSCGYSLQREPLNLQDSPSAQQWFQSICDPNGERHDSVALLLGAVPWMARLLGRCHRRVVVADSSAVMLDVLHSTMSQAPDAANASVDVAHVEWLTLPQPAEPFGIVVGDNSFSFLPFPAGWRELCDILAARMRCGARLLIRVLSVPSNHQSVNVDQLVARFAADDPVNYTAVRTSLLFSHWNPATFEIPTEEALTTFETERRTFDCLLDRLPPGTENDLTTIRKYRGSGAVYYAPPLEAIVELLERRFRVAAIHFGPYPLSRYFPLFVAVKSTD